MRCPRCDRDNRETRRFCRACGAPLSPVCEACGFVNDIGDAYCGGCGIGLRPAPASPQTVPEPPREPNERRDPGVRHAPHEGERRQVTVLIADLKGYTPLAERLGEEAVYQLMDGIYKAMIGVVERHDGTVQELTGDGILALFGAPLAREDAPLAACRAAIAIQDEMREISRRLEAAHGVTARVRIGINTGPVVVASVGNDTRTELKAIGDTVNVAARLESMAEPGTVLLSEATHALVAHGVEAIDLGLRDVKGKAAALRVHRLIRLLDDPDRFARSRRRGLTPLVGRVAELETLARHWQETRAGAWRVVHVVGEAGIGKTRLVHELRERLARDDALVLAGHCAATETASAFLPFAEVLRQLFRVGAEDSPQAAALKIAQGLGILDLDEARSLPYVLNLLGLDAPALQGLDDEIIGAHTRDALGRLLRARSRLSPMLLVLDDVHWLDRASEQLVEQIMGGDERPTGLLVLCTQRPEYRAPWAARPEYAEIRLASLPADTVADLVRRCAGDAALPDDTIASVVDAVGGNPLFAEEVGRYVADQVQRGATGAAAERLAIPSSLQSLTLARIDGLDEVARCALQVAAVAGRRFRLGPVASVTGLGDAAPSVARKLESMNLLVREDGAPDAYAFRHVLVQEAIYQSLLTPRRRQLHRDVGDAIERLYADRITEWVDTLAHHFVQADERARAVHYLARAGERSLRVYALDEADERFRRAVDLADQASTGIDDQRLAEILVRWVHAHYYRRDFRGQAALVERYLARIEKLGASRARALLLFWLGFANAMRWRLEPARSWGEQALTLAETIGDEECIGYACMGLLYAGLGEAGTDGQRRVADLAARALEIGARRHDVYLVSKARWGLAFDHLLSGRFRAGLVETRRIIEIGRSAADPRTIAMGLWGTASLLNLDGEHGQALAMADEALRVSPDPLDRMAALSARGGSLAMLGRTAEALQVLADVREDIVARDFMSLLPGVDGFQGLALVLSGRPAEGTACLEATVQRFTGWGTPRSANLARLILGEIYLRAATGGERLSLSVAARNAGWVLTRGLFAERRARSCLEAAARTARDTGADGILAWALLDLVLLDGRRRRETARRRLDEAAPLVERLGGTLLQQKLTEARAALG